MAENGGFPYISCKFFIAIVHCILHLNLSFLIDVWITSQTMMKLNPMKSPRTPPQSATSDPIEYASSSFSVKMDGLSNQIMSWVVFG